MNDIIRLQTSPLEINIENIITQNDNGDDALNLVYPFVNNFIEKYYNLKNINEQFINYTKNLFELLYVIFNKEYMLTLEELNKDNNIIKFNEDEKVEFELFKEFITNLEYINENIFNFKNENELSNNLSINEKMKSTIKYLTKKNDDMEQLNESMKYLNKSLDNKYKMLKKLT